MCVMLFIAYENKPLLPATKKTEEIIFAELPIPQTKNVPKEDLSESAIHLYYYIKHVLTELPQLNDKNGNIEQSMLEPFIPWSKTLPADYYSKHRK